MPEHSHPLTSGETGEHGLAYAWGKTARILLDTHLTELEGRTGSVTVVDIGSAFPWFTQIVRDMHEKYLLSTAEAAVKNVVNSINTPVRKHHDTSPFAFLKDLSLDELLRLRTLFGPKHSPGRRHMVGALFEELTSHSGNLSGLSVAERERVAYHSLSEKLKTPQRTFSLRWEREDRKGAGRWEIIVGEAPDKSAHESLVALIGEAETEVMFSHLSRYFASTLAPHMRRYLAVSLDRDHPQNLKAEALRSFPQDYQDTVLFQRASALRDHVVGNALAWPFGAETIDLAYSIEGIPFYFDPHQISKESVLRFGEDVHSSLKPGGRAVFFPWMTLGGNTDDESLTHVLETQWSSFPGTVLSLDHLTRNELVGTMLPRERELAERASPLFQNGMEEFTMLTLQR